MSLEVQLFLVYCLFRSKVTIRRFFYNLKFTHFLNITPFSAFELSIEIRNILNIIKGIILSLIVFYLIKKEKFVNVNLLSYRLDCKIKTLIPVIILLVIFLVLKYKVFFSVSTSSDVVFLFLLAMFLGVLCEELLFRGYILNLLINNKLSVLKSILISSLLFSLFHIINIIRHNDIWSMFNQIILAFFIGVLFGSLFILTKNIMVITVMHFFINVPASLSYLNIKNALYESELTNMSFVENLMGSLFLFLIFSPLIFVTIYYLKLIKALYNNSTQTSGPPKNRER